MKDYLPLFKTNTEYDIYDNDIINKVKPNVSYVIDDNECHFNRVRHPLIHAKFDVKYDYRRELLRHTHSIKSLVADGEKVNFPIPVSNTKTVKIDKNKISYNPQTNVHDFPSSYVQKNWYKIQLKPTNANIKITDCNSVLSLIELSGEKYIITGEIEEIAGEVYFNEDLNLLTVTRFAMSYGMNYGLVLAIKDKNTDNYNIVNTTCVFEYTTGGLSTPNYEIGTTGQHTLEIELINDGELGDLFQTDTITHVTKLEDITTLYRSFYKCSSLVSVVLPDTLKTIGLHAFNDCQKLQSIVIPNSVTSIGEDAFFRCTSLTEITIPNSVTTIGHGAFRDCSSLTSITIPDSVILFGDNPFESCKRITKFNSPLATEDKLALISNNKIVALAIGANVVSYNIPDGVTSIGNSAFYGSNLASIIIPDSVTEIGGEAFRQCTSLTSVTIPEGVTSIGNYAFSGCPISEIIIPENVISLGRDIFYNTSTLTTVYSKALVPPQALYSDANSWDAFGPAEGRKIYVPMASVDAYKTAPGWSEYANNIVGFQNQICYLATDNNVITPYDSTVFGANIVSNTYENGVGIITFDDDVTSIGSKAFNGCNNLKSITIPDSVTTIGSQAFNNCNRLTSINIPDGVTEIDEYAFRFCDFLTSITIPGGVTSIGTGAFAHCQSLYSVNLGNGVTSIGNSAFYYCDMLTSITIPDSVTEIGQRAFYSCSRLTSIDIPEGVTTIGEEAFYLCSNLASVYCIPTTPPTGGNHMFGSNPSICKIYVPMASVEVYKAAEYWSDYADAIEGYNF